MRAAVQPFSQERHEDACDLLPEKGRECMWSLAREGTRIRVTSCPRGLRECVCTLARKGARMKAAVQPLAQEGCDTHRHTSRFFCHPCEKMAKIATCVPPARGGPSRDLGKRDCGQAAPRQNGHTTLDSCHNSASVAKIATCVPLSNASPGLVGGALTGFVGVTLSRPVDGAAMPRTLGGGALPGLVGGVALPRPVGGAACSIACRLVQNFRATKRGRRVTAEASAARSIGSRRSRRDETPIARW